MIIHTAAVQGAMSWLWWCHLCHGPPAMTSLISLKFCLVIFIFKWHRQGWVLSTTKPGGSILQILVGGKRSRQGCWWCGRELVKAGDVLRNGEEILVLLSWTGGEKKGTSTWSIAPASSPNHPSEGTVSLICQVRTLDEKSPTLCVAFYFFFLLESGLNVWDSIFCLDLDVC